MTHTPGPWSISQSRGLYSGEARNLYTVSGACGTICTTPNPSVADNAANARLIAAAPELLAALREARDELYAHADANGELDGSGRICHDLVGLCDAAIARATGEA